MRCSCAHGSKFRDGKAVGDDLGKGKEDMKGELVIRIRGCAAAVVAKVDHLSLTLSLTHTLSHTLPPPC